MSSAKCIERDHGPVHGQTDRLRQPDRRPCYELLPRCAYEILCTLMATPLLQVYPYW